MKAVVWTQYGPPDVLQPRDLPDPKPRDDEILVRIRATTVTAGDCELRELRLPFLISVAMRLLVGAVKPKRRILLGQEFAGDVVDVGTRVTRFRKGDRVFGTAGFRSGTYAEFICLPEFPKGLGGVVIKTPVDAGYEDAAAIPVGGLEALHFLRKADIRSGQTVLVNGAGGSIGTSAVQLAKHSGAEVTAVDCGSKLDMLRRIGADRVIDYTREDFTKHGEAYDVIFDVVGKAPIARGMRSLTESGVYLLANPTLSKILRGRWAARGTKRRLLSGAANPTTADLESLRELMEAGALRAVIDRQYPLERVAEAHRYVETGRKAGNVIITVGQDSA